MVPDIAKKGTSFKGAFAYYLHDKRQEGEGARETAERVAWTETRNLATDDSETAKRIMIATARSADQLKEAAGIKATGRKSAAVVYAYSLAWHPDEARTLDRAEMIRAADQSLKVLEADHLQAVIVCHTDKTHPHVHVIVNRIDPNTGKMHGFSNDRLKLSEWANSYERERGQILTAERERKRQEREARSKEQRQKYIAERKTTYERETGHRTKAQHLRDLGAAQKIRHKGEWSDFAALAKAEREKVYSGNTRQIAEATARHKAETKAIWRQYFREVRSNERSFVARERSLAGKIRNAHAAATQQKRMGDTRGTLALTFANVLSSQARAAAFAQRQDMTRQALAAKLKSILDTEIKSLKDHRTAALGELSRKLDQERGRIIERQNAERAKVREAWSQLYPNRTSWTKRREKPAVVKDIFDKSRKPPPPAPIFAPAYNVRVTTAAPTLTPAGSPPAPQKAAQVPAVDKAKEWAATEKGREVIKKQGPTRPQAQRDFAKSAPEPATPAPEAKAEKSRAKPLWEPPSVKKTEPQPAPTRSRSPDYDRDK